MGADDLTHEESYVTKGRDFRTKRVLGCATWCQCSTWGQCSTWCRCSEYIHLRRKPQLEAQGVCKVRVFSNFQSIPSGVRHPNTLWNSCCTTRILAICPCLFYNDDMVIVWRHGHYTEIWPFYNDMAIVRGHGHCMWTWPLYGRHGH